MDYITLFCSSRGYDSKSRKYPRSVDIIRISQKYPRYSYIIFILLVFSALATSQST